MELAHAFHHCARVSRAALYGQSPDRQLPANLVDDAHIPFLGFAGTKYRTGGVVLLAINPGGGGSAYRTRTTQDEQLLPLITAFLRSTPAALLKRFEAMSTNYAGQVRTWNLWRIMYPVLEACEKDLSEVAYLNCFPYRTRGDQTPVAPALRNSWLNIVKPLLHELSPSIVISLGKKVGCVAERQFRGPGRLYVVPRTIGDSYISDQARAVLAQISQDATARLRPTDRC